MSESVRANTAVSAGGQRRIAAAMRTLGPGYAVLEDGL